LTIIIIFSILAIENHFILKKNYFGEISPVEKSWSAPNGVFIR